MAEPEPGGNIIRSNSQKKTRNPLQAISPAKAVQAMLMAWGIPAVESPDFRKEKYPGSDDAEFRLQLNLIFRNGVTTHSHLGLPGMEFSDDDLKAVVRAVMAADEAVFTVDHLGGRPEGGTRLYRKLVSDGSFISASRSCDRNAQIVIGLDTLKLEQRVDFLILAEDMDPDKAEEVAADDIEAAKLAVSDMRSVKEGDTESKVLNLAKDMLATRSRDKNIQIPDFDLALKLIHLQRCPKLAPVEEIPVTIDESGLPENQVEAGAAAHDELPPVPGMPQIPEAVPVVREEDAAKDEEAVRASWTPPMQSHGAIESVALPAPEYDGKGLAESLNRHLDEVVCLMLSMPEERRQELPGIMDVAWEYARSVNGWTDNPAIRVMLDTLDNEIASEQDPVVRQYKSVVRKLIPETLAYEDTLMRLSRMEPRKGLAEIEKELLTKPLTPQEQALAKDLAATEFMLEKYYGPDYLVPSAWSALGAMRAIRLITDSDHELSSRIVAGRLANLCAPTIAGAEMILIQDRAKELMKNARHSVQSANAVAPEDVVVARKMISNYLSSHLYQQSLRAEGRGLPADLLRMKELIENKEEQILEGEQRIGLGAAAFMVIDERKISAEERVGRLVVPEYYARSLAHLAIDYSQKAVVSYAVAIVDSGAKLEFPPSNDPWDPALEKELPEREKGRKADIRRVARTLNLYLYMIFTDEERKQAFGGAKPGLASTNDESPKKAAPATAEKSGEKELMAAKERVDKIVVQELLVRPLMHLVLDYSQKAVVSYATAIVESGAELELPPTNDPWDPSLERELPERENGKKAEIRRLARTLNLYVYMIFNDEERAMAFKGARPGLATSNDESFKETEPAPVQPEKEEDTGFHKQPTERMIRMPTEDMKKRLMPGEKGLISAVMGSEFSEKTLYEFLNMHAGRREVRMRNSAAEAWLSADWREAVPKMDAALDSVYKTCAFPKPSTQELHDAITDPASLSPEQRGMVESFFNLTHGKLSQNDIAMFGVWLRGNQSELTSAWKENFMDDADLEPLIRKMQSRAPGFTGEEAALLAKALCKKPESLRPADYTQVKEVSHVQEEAIAMKVKWFFADKDQRLSQWRREEVDLLTAGDTVHKFRFMADAAFTPEEMELLSMLSRKKRMSSLSELSPSERGDLRIAFSDHTDAEDGTYRPPVMVFRTFGSYMAADSLRKAARRQAQFNTFLGAFGVDHPHVKAFDTDNFDAKAAKRDASGKYLVSDDLSSMWYIRADDGSLILLDGKFDGMGGEKMGEGGDVSNGLRASTIAKNVLDSCALAGWIRTPEDVRRALVMADIAIVTEQMSVMGDDDGQAGDKQVNRMGATASVTFQKGDEFYGISCGDSEWVVIREGKVVLKSTPHDAEYGVRVAAHDMIYKVWQRSDFKMDELDEFQITEFEKQVDDKAAELKERYGSRLKENAVASVLGMPKYIHINNREQGYVPFKLKATDLLMNATDGVTKQVCVHEVPVLIEAASGDIPMVRRQLIKIAETRVGEGPHMTLCQCKSHIGAKTDDDKTLSMRSASEGMGES